jgi:hypothetical protein
MVHHLFGSTSGAKALILFKSLNVAAEAATHKDMSDAAWNEFNLM